LEDALQVGCEQIWLPAALLAVTLVLFVVDERRGR
jgi:hypothetical protein